jgi:hypothetical protein
MTMRCTVKRLMEYLKMDGTPFVEVDEARRALFAGVRFRSFDVVAYSETGPNLLVTCRGFGEDGGHWGETMKRWQEIFGEGFVAVRAVLDKGGQVRFFDSSGGERFLVKVASGNEGIAVDAEEA